MDRKQFLKTCGFACLAGGSIITMLQGCGSSNLITADIKDSDLIVPISHFTLAGDSSIFKKYIVVSNDLLKFPTCIYRLDATNYSALLMECTHQGSELQVYGDKLQCLSHGSEFNNRGVVESGPAYLDLRKFPIEIESDHLKISLRKI